MPRGGGDPRRQQSKSEQARLIWGSGGGRSEPTIPEWDPKSEPFTQAVLEVVASGATLVFRPGSGGRAMGVAIWEGDVRHAPKWCYEADELDQWAAWVLSNVRVDKEDAAD